jgi:uncharacterized alpha/beta hydrolase family protein
MAVFVALLLNGCSPTAIKQNVELDFNASLLGGGVYADPEKQGPIYITAYRVHNDNIHTAGQVRLSQSAAFYLPVPPGMYYLAAFQDLNDNGLYDPHEDCAQFGVHDLINAAPQHFVSDLKMVLDFGNLNSCPHLDRIAISKQEISNQAEAGKTVLPSELFDRRTHVGLGYMKPYYFLKKMGANIWFVEPYDPEKIPILFIHGAGGSPANWKYFVENLNDSVYQPWFFYYPSGLSLEFSAKILALKIQELKTRYEFEQLAIVAHSMGALVTRSLFVHAQKSFPYIKLFVSLSAPWGGVESAKLGAEKSPIKVASWRDLATDSYFINSLYESRLPETVRHYLLFGYKDKQNSLDPNSDGVITFKSMLDNRAQQEAIRVYGFNQNHASILISPDTFAFIKKILREEILPQKQRTDGSHYGKTGSPPKDYD